MVDRDLKPKNQLEGFSGICKETLFFPTEHGVLSSYYTLLLLTHIFSGKDTENIAYQCPCGMLSICKKSEIREIQDEKGFLLCYNCGEYNVRFSFPLFGGAEVAQGINQLKIVLNKAHQENLATLYFFTHTSLSIGRQQIISIRETAALIHDLLLKSDMEDLLQQVGLSYFRMKDPYHKRQQMVLMLMLLNHLIELSPLYDLFVSLLEIAHGNFRLIESKIRLNTSIGCRIMEKDENGNDVDARIKYKIRAIKKACRKYNLEHVLFLLRNGCDLQIRNAFSHSEYTLVNEGMLLTRVGRTVSFDELHDKVFGLYYFVIHVLEFIELQRRTFIEVGEYEESGVKLISSQKDGAFSVTIKC